MAWPAFGFYAFGPATELWWAIAIFAVLSVVLLYAALFGIVARRQFVIEIRNDGFSAYGARFSREQVLSISRYSDLHFKGVRIQLQEGHAVYVPVHQHMPSRVMAAFAQHGYPTGGSP